MTKDEWRTGVVETRAAAYGPNKWITRRGVVTLRPGDPVAAVAASWARDHGYRAADVRVVPVNI